MVIEPFFSSLLFSGLKITARNSKVLGGRVLSVQSTMQSMARLITLFKFMYSHINKLLLVFNRSVSDKLGSHK